MEMKNICGKIPMDLHAKVRQEIEQREISTQEFLQQVIEEHFMEKGVDAMAARTIAVQVTEELFRRLKAAVTWKGCKQKDFLINVITKAIEDVEAEMEQKASEEVEAEHARALAGDEPQGTEPEDEDAGGQLEENIQAEEAQEDGEGGPDGQEEPTESDGEEPIGPDEEEPEEPEPIEA